MNSYHAREKMEEEQDEWIARYEDLFGELAGKKEFLQGQMTFGQLFTMARITAENRLTEAMQIDAIAFQ